MRKMFVKKLVEYAEKNPNLILLTDDLGTNCLEPFIEKFPNRFYNCGIAEQTEVGIAAGLAMEGKKVFMYSIGNFISERALEFLRNLVCYHELDVTCVCVGAGVEYGPLGVTHHAVDDMAGMRALPNMRIYNPASADECSMAMEDIFKHPGPAYLRLNKKGAEGLTLPPKSNIKDVLEYYAGRTTAIFATGSILSEAIMAGETLYRQGVQIGVYSVPVVKPINRKQIEFLANRYENIITLEEHSVIGGLGSAVCEIVAESGARAQVTRFGILDEFTCKVGNCAELRKYYHMNSDSLVEFIKGKLC